MGNRDIEDSLERLDKLTQDEARMASAEQLKMTHSVDNRVRSVDDRVQDIGNDVKCISNKVQGVDDKLDQVNSSLSP
jgi:archaellum component FlaC